MPVAIFDWLRYRFHEGGAVGYPSCVPFVT